MQKRDKSERLCTGTRGLGSWRDRLTNDKQWRRGFSAFEAAVSWEVASNTPSGLPVPINKLFRDSKFGEAELLIAIAEHKVPLASRGHDSQCDVWAFLKTNDGAVSLAVEAKAREPFGNKTLAEWLAAEPSQGSSKNREIRWNYIREHLPIVGKDAYLEVPYQLLHRCAAAVIEAKRFQLQHAAFIVQAFEPPVESFGAFSRMCSIIGVTAEHGRMQFAEAGDVHLGMGWADCPLATDTEVAAAV